MSPKGAIWISRGSVALSGPAPRVPGRQVVYGFVQHSMPPYLRLERVGPRILRQCGPHGEQGAVVPPSDRLRRWRETAHTR
jgi:hypothetical protein